MAKRKQSMQHTDDFKRDAVRLMENRGERTIAQVADDLGIHESNLYHWAKKFGSEAAIEPKEVGETLEQEVRRLRKENALLREEKAILKKAVVLSTRQSNTSVMMLQSWEVTDATTTARIDT